MALALFLSVLLIAACGLIYELIAGTMASYLLGDSILQFSTVIGTYLFAMGVGSWLSRYLGKGLVAKFITIELMVGLVGGFSSTILFFAFAYTQAFRFVLYSLVLVVGILVGLEIPLLMRILKDRFQFRDLVAHVLTFDYLGALGASLLFPLLLVPKLGLVRGSLVFGILNAGVALWSTWLFREQLPRRHALRVTAMIVLGLLGVGLYAGEQAIAAADDNLYSDEIILSRQTSYQRIVLTRWRDDVRLYLSSHLQFSSRDEYRYHEGLVHPLMASLPWARRVLILGGGDGLAAREVLKYPQVEQIVLVDLDPEMTKLFATHEYLKGLNGGSLTERRMKVVNADAFVWLEENPEMFDAVIIDFPDPTNFSLGKLYTTAFYRLLGHHVAEHGQIVVQSTSPLFARQSFWCIVETLEAAKFVTRPYHVYVPSFGEWGFILAGRKAWEAPEKLPADLKFLTLENLRSLFEFPLDMNRIPAEPNRLNDQVLVRYYEEDWKKLTH